MEDPGAMRMREPFGHLGARLDRVGVVELACAQRLAEGTPGHELVRDVDVPGVAGECICAQAAGMAQPCGSGSLALGPRRRLPFAGDDLQRDVEARPLVAGEPDRARPAAPEGPK